MDKSGRSILAVVPARGGSRGIPLKNLRSVRGVSLVGLTGYVVAALDWIDRAVVSTDHEDIAREAESHHLAAPFRRSARLSGDTISDWQVLDEALRTMEEIDQRRYDIVIMLQPTSPLRTPDMVTAALQRLIDGGHDSVWTVSPTDSKSHPLKQLTVAGDNSLGYYDKTGSEIIARQQLSDVFHRNGVAYVMTRECIMNGDILGKQPGALVIEEPLSNIDSMNDIALTEFLIDHHKLDWVGRPWRRSAGSDTRTANP